MIEIIKIEAQNCRRNETKYLIKRRVVIYLGKGYGWRVEVNCIKGKRNDLNKLA